jgi:hypothetical protein
VRWWTDPVLAAAQDVVNKDTILRWLQGPADSAVGFFVCDYDIWPHIRVVIPQDEHIARLIKRANPLQSGLEDWEGIKTQRNAWYSDQTHMLVDSFEDAMSLLEIFRTQT